MKQTSRFFFKPNTYVNQLQYSRFHTGYLLFFSGASLLETIIASGDPALQHLAAILEPSVGLSGDAMLWALLTVRWAAFLVGAGTLTTFFFLAGSLLGHRSSFRVWVRRISVVLAIFFLSYAMRFLTPFGWFFHGVAALGWTWGFLLAFYALKEQFEVTSLEASVIVSIAFVASVGVWNIAGRSVDAYASLHTPPAVTRVRPGLPTH